MNRRAWGAIWAAASAGLAVSGADFPRWQQLSSRHGDLPVPGESQQQTGALIADLDQDGRNDFVLSFRQKAPALVWYRRNAGGWTRIPIENEYLTVEAGGAVYDIDQDGDPDLVFGGDWQSNEVWWWENPGPNYDPATPWKRHLVKRGGATQHHDQAFGDFLGQGRAQLAFWNQGARKILLAPIPPNPRQADNWPPIEIFSGSAGEEGRDAFKYPEGMSVADLDGDGQADLLAGNCWFKHLEGTGFKAVRIAPVGGLIRAGRLKPGKVPQVVIAPGDGVGPLRWYECTGDPADGASWTGHPLLERDVVHGHSLELADLNGDGNLDIFCAEMAKWHENQAQPDHPQATAWIFYGDGQGRFTRTELVVGQGFHEAKVGDLNGDGRPDILNKPYNWDTPRVDVWLNQGAGPSPAGASGTTGAICPAFKGPLGLSLYSLRRELAKDLPGTLASVRKLGFAQLELAGVYGAAPENLRAHFDAAGLQCLAAHVEYQRLRDDLLGAALDVRKLGATYAVLGWVPHGDPFTLQDAERTIDELNRWGEALKSTGLEFLYHVQGYEFAPGPKGTWFDSLVLQTNPQFVNFELDLFWTVHAGHNPVKLLEQYPRRFPVLLLKDMKKGTPTGLFTGQATEDSSVALGTGQVDLPAVVREAGRIGVKSLLLGDDSPEAAAHLPQSLRFLQQLAP